MTIVICIVTSHFALATKINWQLKSILALFEIGPRGLCIALCINVGFALNVFSD